MKANCGEIGLARDLLFHGMSAATPSWKLILTLTQAGVYQFLDEFPDDEVDDVFLREFRKRVDTNGERLQIVGNALGVNLFYTENLDERMTRIREMLL